MDGYRFDRMIKTLAAALPRRDALKSLGASGVAALGSRLRFHDSAEGKKKKKKKKKDRCRDRRQSCGGKKKCCGKNTACRSFPTPTCMTLSGRRCCGLEGAPCSNDPDINNCDCCDGLFCGGFIGEPGHCQEEPS